MNKEKKRVPILFLDNTFTFGGAINSLLYLLRAIDKNTYEPILITGQPDTFLKDKFRFIQYYRVNIKLPWIHNYTFKKITNLRLFSSGLFYSAAKKIRHIFWLFFITFPEAFHYYKIGKKHNVRIVHLNNILGSQLAGILASKMLRVPCVAHLRHFEIPDSITRLYAKLIDEHIAISNAIKENLLELNVPNEKITVIFDAIDLDEFNKSISFEYLKKEFHISDKNKLFGIFGRIISWKGIKEFISAAEIVFKLVPESSAFIVGDRSDGESLYYQEVLDLISKKKLNDKIILTGFRTDISALMKIMNVVVHASTEPEPFGLVLIEAMAMAKPVISTNIGGPIDIVDDGKTGLLIDSMDFQTMAQAIAFLLKERKTSEMMGRKGFKKVNDLFTKERYAKQIQKLYGRIL